VDAHEVGAAYGFVLQDLNRNLDHAFSTEPITITETAYQVVRLFISGYTQDSIAVQLNLDRQTTVCEMLRNLMTLFGSSMRVRSFINDHLRSLNKLMGIRNARELLKFALEHREDFIELMTTLRKGL
jgi:DNA-binding CsgD family transcriptional regulator